MKIRIKIQGALIFLGLGAMVLFSNFVFPEWKNRVLDYALDALGFALVLFGFLFRISARGYKEERTNNGNSLVKDGPYAIVRNPMYFGSFIIGTGVIIMFLKLWFFLIFTAIFLMIYMPQMKKEEDMLLDRFGHEYKEYCRVTPKYFPKSDYLLRLNQYVSLKPFWVKKEMFSFIPAIILIVFMEIWEHIR